MNDKVAQRDEDGAVRLAAQLKALGHPARLRILEQVAARGTCVSGEIVGAMPLAQATVSQHLKMLKEAGLVRGAVDGRRSCYCLDHEALAHFRAVTGARLDALARPPKRWEPTGMTTANDDVRAVVREKYAALAGAAPREEGCGCAPSCCSDGSLDMIGDAYRGVAGHVPEADLGLGCGLPTRHAGIEPGDVVLDLGSGAGNDAFVARRGVGETGRVIGVDMTPEMILRARANAGRLGYANVEFRLGEIEHLPVESGSVDVAISNCVLNLVPDKPAAFAELARVLKPGGRFCISDIVATGVLPEPVRSAAALWVGCVAGALPETAYLRLLAGSGLAQVEVVESRPVELPDEALAPQLGPAAFAAFREAGTRLLSVTVVGTKPS